MICHGPNTFQHLKGAKIAWRQLAARLIFDPGRGTLVKTEPDPISFLELKIAMQLVMG